MFGGGGEGECLVREAERQEGCQREENTMDSKSFSKSVT